MAKRKKDDGIFHDTAKKKADDVDHTTQERRWKQALIEAKQSVFEVFEDRGPGVSVPPAGMARRDERGRR
jgi:hypothetical protein